MSIATPQPLQVSERCEFELIVNSAKRAGWLHADDEIEAVVHGSDVTIEVTRSMCRQVRSYAHGHQWLFRFLTDLAQGQWNPRRDEHFG